MNSQDQIAAFRDFNNAPFDKISERVIYKAIQINKVSVYLNFSCEPHPTDNGGMYLVFFFKNGNHFLNIEIEPDLKLNYSYEIGKGTEYVIMDEAENVSKKELRRQFKRVRQEFLKAKKSLI